MLLTIFVAAANSQTKVVESNQSSSPAPSSAPASRTFFPHNWIRGYTDFGVAPSHNEPDLGRCMFPQPASAGGRC